MDKFEYFYAIPRNICKSLGYSNAWSSRSPFHFGKDKKPIHYFIPCGHTICEFRLFTCFERKNIAGKIPETQQSNSSSFPTEQARHLEFVLHFGKINDEQSDQRCAARRFARCVFEESRRNAHNTFGWKIIGESGPSPEHRKSDQRAADAPTRSLYFSTESQQAGKQKCDEIQADQSAGAP